MINGKLFRIFLLFVITGSTGAQIPVNGFGGYRSLNIEAGFTQIFPVIFNDDAYTDILLANPELNLTKTFKGNFKNLFVDSVISKTGFSFSKIHLFNVKELNYYAFTSRKDRTAGLFEIDKNGSVKIKKTIKLNSFPENLAVADVEQDGIDEILISGSSFQGLSILNSIELIEKKIDKKRAYSSAVFADLSNDEIQDVAAIDLLSNSVKFFFNNFTGEFEFVREINFDEKISQIQSYDFNLDGYPDLALIKGGKIHFLLGDSVSSYENEITLNTKFAPDKFLIADFNSDGFNDLAYLNKNAKIISVVFAKDKKNFYEEIIVSNSDVDDISLYISKFIKGIIALNRNGKISLISQIRSLSDESAIKLGAKPVSLTYFDASGDKIIDFAYIDEASQKLNLIKRNSSGMPADYYQIPLSENYNSISVESISKDKSIFHCYRTGRKLIDVIIVNFTEKKFQTERIYAGGNILDLKLQSGNLNERPDIYVLLSTRDGLKLNVLSHRNFRYTAASSKSFDRNVKSAKLALKNSIDVFYWKFDNKILQYYYLKVDKNLEPVKRSEKYVLPASERYKISGMAGDIFNNEKNASINFINADELNYAIVSDEERNFKMNFTSDKLSISGEENLFLGEYKYGGTKKIFYYNNVNNSMDKIEFSAGKKSVTNKIATLKNAGSYFVKSLNFKNYHIVYIDKEENCIRIREL